MKCPILFARSSNRVLSICLLALLILGTTASKAEEQVKICAKYEAQYGWSKGYSVEATKLSGMELNEKTGTFKFNSLATYVAIFWDKDQVSLIRLMWPFLTPVAQDGEDMRGVKWKIAETDFCF